MNKILSDFISCTRKRLITDKVGNQDAALEFAQATWFELTSSASRTIIRDTPALREAMALNGFPPNVHDKVLRAYLKETASNG